jgi:NitT/TauT family transport system ATP-binding protein
MSVSTSTNWVTSDRETLVFVRDLARTYGSGPGAVQALASVSFDIAPAEFITILGPSGCGKTTLLNIIAGFDTASEGFAAMGDAKIVGPSSRLGVVFQDSSALFSWFTVRGNIAFGPRAAGRPSAEIAARVNAVLDLVGLTEFADKYPLQLSGGMRQLVAIARVLVMDAELLLMDEPFAALDAIARQRMQERLVEIWTRTKPAILFITHSVDEALYLGDRVIVMTGRPGRIREILDINLARPRDLAAPAFNDLRAKALSLLRSTKEVEP